jgi:bacterioferritin (cytochrome b1)
MSDIKTEIIGLLNKALELEHTARIQYLSHAELVDGLNSEDIVARLKEIAEDEAKHQEKFRTMIGNYLDGVPSAGINPAKKAESIHDILSTNLKDEKTAIDFYKKVAKKITENKESLPYSFLQLEHSLRHVIMDEEEHISELRMLLSMTIKDVEEKV